MYSLKVYKNIHYHIVKRKPFRKRSNISIVSTIARIILDVLDTAVRLSVAFKENSGSIIARHSTGVVGTS
jgi:hypothetical protein